MDFQHIEDRKGTSCVKWDHMEGTFGRKDLLPLWVADMDFKAPAEVLTAVKEREVRPTDVARVLELAQPV